jgi:hypothetical protein
MPVRPARPAREAASEPPPLLRAGLGVAADFSDVGVRTWADGGVGGLKERPGTNRADQRGESCIVVKRT